MVAMGADRAISHFGGDTMNLNGEGAKNGKVNEESRKTKESPRSHILRGENVL